MAANNNDVKNEIYVHNPDGAVFDRPRGIEVSLRLDQFYRQMVAAANFECQNDTERFIEIVKFYVFSGALFEAWINAFLRRYLEHWAKGLGSNVFYLAERTSIKDKYSFIGQRYSLEWWGSATRTIDKVVSYRNRLMHFKDAPDLVPDDSVVITATDGVVSIKDLYDGLFAACPNPRLYDDLMDQDIATVRDEVLTVYDKLCELQTISGKNLNEK